MLNPKNIVLDDEPLIHGQKPHYLIGRTSSLVLVDSLPSSGNWNKIILWQSRIKCKIYKSQCLRTNTRRGSAVTRFNKVRVLQRGTNLGPKNLLLEQNLPITKRHLVTKPVVFPNLDQVNQCQII